MVSCDSWWSLYKEGEISLYSGEQPLVRFSLKALEVIKGLPIKTTVEFSRDQRNSTGVINLFILENGRSCSIQSEAPFYEKRMAAKIGEICKELCFGWLGEETLEPEKDSFQLRADPMLAEAGSPILYESAESADEDPILLKRAESAVEDPVLPKRAESVVEDLILLKRAESAVEDPVLPKRAESAVEDLILLKRAESVVEDPVLPKRAESVVGDSILQKRAKAAVKNKKAHTPSLSKKVQSSTAKKACTLKSPRRPRDLYRQEMQNLPRKVWPYRCGYCGRENFRVDNMITHVLTHELNKKQRSRESVVRKQDGLFTEFFIKNFVAS